MLFNHDGIKYADAVVVVVATYADSMLFSDCSTHVFLMLSRIKLRVDVLLHNFMSNWILIKQVFDNTHE